MSNIEARLRELGIVLPLPPKAIGNFVYGVATPGLLTLSGTYGTVIDEQGRDVLSCTGKVGDDVSPQEAYASARTAAVNLFAMAKAVLGDLDRIVRVVRVGGMVATSPGFFDAPSVVNGASDLFVEVLGPERGRHARVAFPVHELARNAPVACEASFQLREAAA